MHSGPHSQLTAPPSQAANNFGEVGTPPWSRNHRWLPPDQDGQAAMLPPVITLADGDSPRVKAEREHASGWQESKEHHAQPAEAAFALQMQHPAAWAAWEAREAALEAHGAALEAHNAALEVRDAILYAAQSNLSQPPQLLQDALIRLSGSAVAASQTYTAEEEALVMPWERGGVGWPSQEMQVQANSDVTERAAVGDAASAIRDFQSEARGQRFQHSDESDMTTANLFRHTDVLYGTLAEGGDEVGYACQAGMNPGERQFRSAQQQQQQQHQHKFSRFAQLATAKLLRTLLGPQEPTPTEVGVTIRALQTERARRQLQLQQDVNTTPLRVSLLQAQERRISQLVEQLERMRFSKVGLRGCMQDVLKVVLDINDLRCDTDGMWVGKEFGRRCGRMSFKSGWLQACTSGSANIATAIAFGSGQVDSGWAPMQLTSSKLAGKGIRLQQICQMSSEDYKQIYRDYASSIRDVLGQVTQGNARLDRLAEQRAACLMQEFAKIEHIFFISHPSHYASPDAWVLESSMDAIGITLGTYERAIAAAHFTYEQRAHLWALWDQRTLLVEELQREHDLLSAHVTSKLEDMAAQNEKWNRCTMYIDLLKAVSQLRLKADEASVTNSVFITRSIFEGSTPLQVARIIATAYPAVLNPNVLYEMGCLPRP